MYGGAGRKLACLMLALNEFSSRLTLHFTRFIAAQRGREGKILNVQNYGFSAEEGNFLSHFPTENIEEKLFFFIKLEVTREMNENSRFMLSPQA
jgi:hypothetical protein